MHCMKCGQDTGGSEVFCRDCLAEMEKYPVKPGAPVYIPSRANIPRKAPRHPVIDPEEQIRRLQRRIRRLTAGLIAALIALALAGGAILYLYEQPDNPFSIGQDYNVSGGASNPGSDAP